MRHIIILFILGISLIISSCSSKTKTDLEIDKLKGEVQFTHTIEIKDGIKTEYISQFNEKGMRINYLEESANKKVKIDFFYKENLLDKSYLNALQDSKEVKSIDNFEHNDKGQLIKYSSSIGGDNATVYFEYNNDKLIKEIKLDGSYSKQYFYSSDLDSIIQKDLVSEPNDEKIYRVQSFYYGENDNLIKKTISQQGVIYWTYNYEYDIEGNIIKVKSVNNKEETQFTKFDYTYDSKGNWTEKVEIDGEGNQIKIMKRKIYYYGEDITKIAQRVELFSITNNKNNELTNSYNEGTNSSDYTTYEQSSNSNQEIQIKKQQCRYCNGTGKCRTCNKVFRTHYWDGKNSGWKNSNETRPGQVMCTTCNGAGVLYGSKSYGEDPQTKPCYNSSCKSGWIFCQECNYSGNGQNLGQCIKCKGSGYYN